MLGTEPSARMQWEPSTVRPSVSVTVTVSPSRVTDSIRDFESTFIPRRVSTSSSTAAASASSPGSTRSREETSVTWIPSERYAEANSAPVTPEPTTISSVGHLGQVVDLLPGEDPLAVGLRASERPGRGTGREQHRVGAQRLLAAVGERRPRPGRGRRAGRGRGRR